jgi:hypothetical protein
MPCDTMVLNERQRLARELALKTLASDLESGLRTMRVVKNPVTRESRVVISLKVGETSWADSACGRTGLQEGCAVAGLETRGWASHVRSRVGVKAKNVHRSHSRGHKQ